MDFQWTFEILDYKASEFPTVTVRASSQAKAYSKIKKLKLKELNGVDIKTQLRLLDILELPDDMVIDWEEVPENSE